MVDVGGFSFGKEINGQEVKFRFKNDTPIAYQDFNFTNNGKANPIKEIILGPKNKSLLTGVSVYLEYMGIGEVMVSKLRVPYIKMNYIKD